jgi:hypothetical protein
VVVVGESPSNKCVCLLVRRRRSRSEASPSHRGDGEVLHVGVVRAEVELLQGSAEAALGSGIMTAFCSLPFKMIVRRLLPRWSSASVLPGRRLQVKSNL